MSISGKVTQHCNGLKLLKMQAVIAITQKPQIQIKKVYPHSIERVWKAITTKDALSEWLMPTMDFELLQGCAFQFKTKPQGNFDGVVNCEIIRIDAPNLIAYSWSAKGFKQPTVVTWQLVSLSKNETSLTLSHNGFVGFNGWVTKQILNFGWRGILRKKLTSFLNIQNDLS